MLIRNRAPSDPFADSFSRTDVVRDKDRPMPPEDIQGHFYSRDTRSHDVAWADRREDSLMRFADRVKAFVEPMGFVEAFSEAAPHATREVELQWLIDTQDSDIAPEYTRLSANGVQAFSMYTSYFDEDGEEHQIADDIAENLWTTAIAEAIDKRAEEFLRLADRQRWYSGRPKVAYMVVDDQGRRGLVPKKGHPWTREQLLAAMASLPEAPDIAKAMQRRKNQQFKRERAQQGLEILLSPVERTKTREFQRVLHWLDALDEDCLRNGFHEQNLQSLKMESYAPNEDCPSCIDGRTIDEDGETVPCPVCRGDQKVAHTLGFDGIPAIDGDD